MSYVLGEARRLLRSMTFAQDVEASNATEYGKAAAETAGDASSVALNERVELDATLPGGRLQRLGEVDRPVGGIQLTEVSESVDQALVDLGDEPPALGAALVATERALEKIRWRSWLKTPDLAKARSQLIQDYGLLLDKDPRAMHELRQSSKLLADLPDGRGYAKQLSQVLKSNPPDKAGLVGLIRSLDSRIKSSRRSAERSHLAGRATAHR